MSRLVLLLVLMLTACSAPSDAADPRRSVGTPPTTQTAPPAAPSPASPSPPDSERPRPTDPDPEQRPAYVAWIEPIGPALRERMRFSHRAGCPVRLSELRYLRVSFVGFDREAHLGELVVHRDHARGVSEVFRQLYEGSWPIQRMQLVDDYDGDDDRSMAANNTSGYNCRRVSGSASWSTHAYGAAIDINPVQNPYVTPTSTVPPAGRSFADIDRSADADAPVGVILDGDVVVRAFSAIGWEWGGHWTGSKDYQHFSASGG